VLRHELVDQLVERLDPVLGGAAVEQAGAAGVPGGQVAQGSLAFVLVLDALPALDGGGGGQRRVLARSGLDRGFLIAADDVVAGVQQFALPPAAVEVENAAGLDG
jgi:hypothetical protein